MMANKMEAKSNYREIVSTLNLLIKFPYSRVHRQPQPPHHQYHQHADVLPASHQIVCNVFVVAYAEGINAKYMDERKSHSEINKNIK